MQKRTRRNPNKIVKTCILCFEGTPDIEVAKLMGTTGATITRWRKLELWKQTEERLIEKTIDEQFNPKGETMFILNVADQTYGSINSSLNTNYVFRFFYKKGNNQENYDLSCIIKIPGENKKGILLSKFKTEEHARKAFIDLHQAIADDKKVWNVEECKSRLNLT